LEVNLNTNNTQQPLLRKIGMFFTRPAELFDGYKERPAWALKLLLITVVMALCSNATKILGNDLYVELLEKQAANMPAEQAEAVRASAGFMNSPLMNVLTAVSGAITIIATIFFLSLVYMAFIKILGGKIKYMQAVAVYETAYIAVCIGTIAQIAYMYITKNLIYINLEPTIADVLYNALDPFRVWQAILLVLGFSAVSNIPHKKSVVMIATIWLLSLGVSLIPVLMRK